MADINGAIAVLAVASAGFYWLGLWMARRCSTQWCCFIALVTTFLLVGFVLTVRGRLVLATLIPCCNVIEASEPENDPALPDQWVGHATAGALPGIEDRELRGTDWDVEIIRCGIEELRGSMNGPMIVSRPGCLAPK